MTFDFVIETPQNRRINRNNNKIIQKRATQAGARTRLGNKSIKQSPNGDRTKIPSDYQLPELANKDLTVTIISNAGIAGKYNSPFLSRFGMQGQMLYLRASDQEVKNACFRLEDSTLSILQGKILRSLASHPISADANRLFKVMTLTKTQFLGHLPSHYGHLAFVDEAMECVIARLNDTVPLVKISHNYAFGPISPTILYAKALQSLRSAIDNQSPHNLSYIWFAIMLLTLFELLSMGDEPGWVWHAAGAARILYKVGPDNIMSEFHLSLLASQCRIMVVETIFTNKPCYLADPYWQKAIRRTVLHCDDFADRSQVNTELWAIGARIPNLFQAVSDHVHGYISSETFTPKAALQRLLNDLIDWKCSWREVLETTCRDVLRKSSIRHQSLMILLAFYMLSTISYRLRVAIDPIESLGYETEALMACASVFSLRKAFTLSRWSAHFNHSLYGKVANGTQLTAPTWKAEIEHATIGEPFNVYTFTEWCESIGRSAKRIPAHPFSIQGDIQ